MPNLEQEIGAIYLCHEDVAGAARLQRGRRGCGPAVAGRPPGGASAHTYTNRPGADWPRGCRLTGRHSAAGVFRMRYRVQDRRALEGTHRNQLRCETERAHVGGEVHEPKRSGKVAEVLEHAEPVRPIQQAPALLLGEARADVVLGRSGLVDGGDAAKAGAGQRAGALHHLTEDDVQVQAGADVMRSIAAPRAATR